MDEQEREDWKAVADQLLMDADDQIAFCQNFRQAILNLLSVDSEYPEDHLNHRLARSLVGVFEHLDEIGRRVSNAESVLGIRIYDPDTGHLLKMIGQTQRVKDETKDTLPERLTRIEKKLGM